MKITIAITILSLGALIPSLASAQSDAPADSSIAAPPPSEPLPALPAAALPVTATPSPTLPATTETAEPAELSAVKSGFEVGFRLAYGMPLGQATAEPGDDLSKTFGGSLPFTLDLGARLGSQFFIGGYLGYGPGSAAQCRAGGVTCSASTTRLGLELHYSFLTHGPASPWVGYGAGYELSNFNAKGPAGEANVSVGGFEFGHFMAGIDYRVLSTKKHPREFGFGPFVDLSLAQFTKETQDLNNVTQKAGSIANPALHEWFMIGVRFVALP